MTDLNTLLKDVVIPERESAAYDRYVANVTASVKRDYRGVTTNLAWRRSGENVWYRSDIGGWDFQRHDYAIIPEPKPPVITPYTWEQRHELRDRWYRIKGEQEERCVRSVAMSGDDFYIDHAWTLKGFLQNCEWINPATGEVTGPCGNVQ
jgi:hypothetical protein